MQLIPGKVYRRRDLHAHFGGQQQGGISTPAKWPVILLFTGDQGNLYGYSDGIQPDGTFWYTGEGQIGDMQLVRGNWAIRNHSRLDKELHLFEYVDKGEVRYRGQAHYLDHHTEVAPDREKQPRQVIVFELAIDSPHVGAPELEPDAVELKFPKLWRTPLNELRRAAFDASYRDALPTERKSYEYFRSEVIKVYVLRRAQGFCEGCENPAPFPTAKGTPYLEPHHLLRRADNGPDHPLWVIALCPNCHARVHHGADGREYNIRLAQRVERIEGGTLPLAVAT